MCISKVQVKAFGNVEGYMDASDTTSWGKWLYAYKLHRLLIQDTWNVWILLL